MIDDKVLRCIRNIEILIKKKNISKEALSDIDLEYWYPSYIEGHEMDLTLYEIYQLSELLDIPIRNLIDDNLGGA